MLVPYLYSCEIACQFWYHLCRLILRSLQCASLWSLFRFIPRHCKFKSLSFWILNTSDCSVSRSLLSTLRGDLSFHTFVLPPDRIGLSGLCCCNRIPSDLCSLPRYLSYSFINYSRLSYLQCFAFSFKTAVCRNKH